MTTSVTWPTAVTFIGFQVFMFTSFHA